MSTIGYATLPVIPSLQGMESSVRSQLRGLSGVSSSIGGESGRGFVSTFGSNVASGLTTVGDSVTRWARRGFLAAGATAGAVIATGLWGGLQRALDREDAIVTFRRMGLDDANIAQLTDSIDQALRGTPITNPEGFALAGRFLAQGFDAADLPGVISTIADIATVGNRGFSEMADVLVVAAGQGRITADELNRMGDVPLGRVAEQLGLTEAGMRDLVSEGGLTAEAFLEAFAAVEEFSGAARDATTRVAWSNLKTQISAIGEQFLGPLLGEGGAAQQALLNLRERIGALGPAAADLGQRFADWLVPAVQRAADWFNDVFVPALRNVRDFLDENRDMIGRVVAAVGPAIGVIAGLATSISLVTTALRLMALATPVGIILALVSGLIYAWQNSETFREVVTTAWEAIVAFVGPLIETVVGWLSGVADWFTDLVGGADGMRAGVSGSWEAIQQAVAPVIAWFDEHVGPLIRSVTEFIIEWWGLVSSAFSTVMDQIRTVWDVIGEPTMVVIKAAWEQLKDAAMFIWDAIRIVIETVMGVIRGIIDTVTALIRGDWSGVWEAIKGIVNTVWTGIKESVENSVGFLRDTISNTLDAIRGVWEDIWGRVSSFLSDTWDGVKTATSEAWEDLKDGLSESLDTVLDWFTSLPGDMLDALGDLASILFEAGRAIIDGLWDGLKDMWTNVSGWFSGLGDRISGGVSSALGINSPARVMIPLGSAIGEGLMVGMDKSLPGVEASADQLADLARRQAAATALQPLALDASPAATSRSGTSGLATVDRQLLARIAAAVEADREITMDGQAVGRQLSRAFA